MIPTKGNVSSLRSIGGGVSLRGRSSTNGLDNEGNYILQWESASTLARSPLDVHTQVQNTTVSRWDSGNVHLDSRNQLT